jgi:signal transduction histidine kinase
MVDLPAAPPNPAAPDQRATHADGAPMSRPARRMVRIADSLPDWLGSVRFRLTATYSLVLFGLAAFMVAGLYTVLAVRLHDERVWRDYEVTKVEPVPGGFQLTPTRVQAEYRTVEQLANERSLALLRTYSASALFLLFLASLGVGWFVAGRVLAPIGRITAVARDIQATDLSRRIDLHGPPDELKELADTFDAMLTRLDDAFAGQQRFIQEASHELRNPLAVIRTNLEVALADPDPDPVELRHTAELVNRTASRMSRLVDDLMVYGRRGAPAHDLAPVELGPVADEVAEEFRAPAGERHIEVVARTQPGLWVQGDRIALRQALANLLTNAVRLAPEGSTITVSAARAPIPGAGAGAGSMAPGAGVEVAVADEGPGIAPEHRELVFQRFWRGNASSARDDDRSGLGLAIVDQIARDHDGSVTLADNAGGGSTFTLHLPAVPPPSA